MPQSAEFMRKIGPKKGEVRNPKGINHFTKARARAAEVLAENSDQILERLLQVADDGDVNALKFLAGPIIPSQVQQVEHSGSISLQWEEPQAKPKKATRKKTTRKKASRKR